MIGRDKGVIYKTIDKTGNKGPKIKPEESDS